MEKERHQYLFTIYKNDEKAIVMVESTRFDKALEAVKAKYSDWSIDVNNSYQIMPSLQAY